MASKKAHPADAAERALIREAVGFTASIFIGAGQFEKAQASTLIEARQHAAAFADRIKNGRRPMIYAGLADGRQIFVPDNYQPETEQTMTTEAETKIEKTKPAKAKATKKRVAKKKAAKKVAAKRSGKAPRKNGAAKSERRLGKRAAILAAAEAGKLPAVPDFSAPTHERFRNNLAEVVALVKACDVRKLKAFKINPVSSSPKAVARYRDLVVIALSAKATRG